MASLGRFFGDLSELSVSELSPRTQRQFVETIAQSRVVIIEMVECELQVDVVNLTDPDFLKELTAALSTVAAS